MNGLLHSKTFRKNVSKWGFMYIAVMCLFTSVITYSKYITELGMKDEARASMFNVSIEPVQIDPKSGCNGSLDTNGSMVMSCGLKRPTSKFTYYFKVVSEVEVPTEIIVRVSGGDNKNYRKDDENLSSMIINSISLCADNTCSSLKDTKEINKVSGIYDIKYDLSTKVEKKEYYFKVEAQFDHTKFTKDEYGNIIYAQLHGEDQINIGYSATQVTGEKLATAKK